MSHPAYGHRTLSVQRVDNIWKKNVYFYVDVCATPHVVKLQAYHGRLVLIPAQPLPARYLANDAALNAPRIFRLKYNRQCIVPNLVDNFLFNSDRAGCGRTVENPWQRTRVRILVRKQQ